MSNELDYKGGFSILKVMIVLTFLVKGMSMTEEGTEKRLKLQKRYKKG